ncbi:glycosyltransferase [Paenibacillus sp. GCM10027628]|uniref:glycosyltransferase n=1 Tax=Paenibacillus sp. GCM10027628 TaxID=3273413 RepID=UPI00363DAD1F
MKIVQVCRDKYKIPPEDNGSIEFLIYWLVEELVKRGHEVITYAPYGSKLSGKVIHYPAKRITGKQILDLVVRTLPKDVDIIHDHMGVIAKANLPTPTLFHSHDPFRKDVQIPLYVSRNILNGEGLKKGFYLNNGIRVEDYQFQPKKEDYLLFLGRLLDEKGAHHAIEIAKRTGKRLLIAGPVQDEQYFKDRIKPYLDHQISYVGPTSGQHKQNLLKNAQCLLFPTNFEDPFPLVPLEALACGTPVVALRRGGLPEQLHGLPGLICDSVDKMVEMVKKGKFPTPLQCRKYIKKYYTIPIMTENLLQIYRSILDSNMYKPKRETKTSDQTIHVVMATNDNYAKHLAVMLNSLLENKVSKNPIQIYVIGSDISATNKSLLDKTAGKFNLKIKYKEIDPAAYKDFATYKYVTKETYYRLSIPDLLHEKVHKAIYLDSDIIVKEDITKLWNINMDGYFLGAVEDCLIKDARNSDLYMPRKSKYFNAGVLVLNLKKWRAEKIKNKIFEFIKTKSSRIKYCDQDALNAILHDKWRQLDPKWNFQSQYLSYPDLKIKPAVIHYTGRNKPWDSEHPLKEEYFKYKKNMERKK